MDLLLQLDTQQIGWIGTGLLAMAAMVYIGLPLMLKSTIQLQLHPVMREFDPEENPPPEAVQKFFRKVQHKLGAANFETAAFLTMPELVTNVASILLLLENRVDNVLALAVAAYTKEGDTRQLRAKYVEFSSEQTDGAEISTNNSEEINAFAKIPERMVLQFPMIADPVRLFAAHRKHLEAHATGRLRTIPALEELVDEVRLGVEKELRQQIDTGFLYVDEDASKYRPTFKGAFLMTWKQLWPFTSVIKSLRTARAKRLIAEWDL